MACSKRITPNLDDQKKLNNFPEQLAWMPRSSEILLSGTIIYGDDLQTLEGYISIREGTIKEIGTEKVDADLEGIVCPRFVNAHVHVGDSAFKDPPFLPLSDLVGPGGLKNHLLERTPRDLLIEGMRRSLQDMAATGTFAFADFREGGEQGVKMLLEAQQGLPLTSRILGRPQKKRRRSQRVLGPGNQQHQGSRVRTAGEGSSRGQKSRPGRSHPCRRSRQR